MEVLLDLDPARSCSMTPYGGSFTISNWLSPVRHLKVYTSNLGSDVAHILLNPLTAHTSSWVEFLIHCLLPSTYSMSKFCFCISIQG